MEENEDERKGGGDREEKEEVFWRDVLRRKMGRWNLDQSISG